MKNANMQNEAPLFSVFIPTYNRAYALPRAIDSVLAQTFTDFELLIVDDCSTDNTQEILASYNDCRIRVLHHDINSGVQSGYITAIDNMKGQWQVPLGSTKFLSANALSILSDCINSLPDDIKRIRFGAANVTNEGVQNIDAGYASGANPKEIIPAGDSGLCTHVDILRRVKPIAGINGYECEWGWRIRKETKEFFIDDILYFCHRTKDGNHLSFLTDNGTDLMSAADQRLLLIKLADKQYFIDNYNAGINLLYRFVNECQVLGCKKHANAIRRYAKSIDIPVPPRLPNRGMVLWQENKERLKRFIVRVLRRLNLKPPAPREESSRI